MDTARVIRHVKPYISPSEAFAHFCIFFAVLRTTRYAIMSLSDLITKSLPVIECI